MSEQGVLPALQLGRRCTVFRTILVTVVLSIYFSEWFVYHVYCTPVLSWAILFNVVFLMAIWSYLATSLTDPGTRWSKEWEAWSLKRTSDGKGQAPDAAAQDEEPRLRANWKPGAVTWCKKCKSERPERSHHCGDCGTCILRMDHHCPWIGGCIGWRNHKAFLLLNLWSFLTCLTFLVSLRTPNSLEALNILKMALDTEPSMMPFFGVTGAWLFLLVTGGMFFQSLNQSLRNITVIEELFPGENPYRMHHDLDNLRQVVGPLDWKTLLPIPYAKRPPGTSFPLNDHRASSCSTAPQVTTSYGAV